MASELVAESVAAIARLVGSRPPSTPTPETPKPTPHGPTTLECFEHSPANRLTQSCSRDFSFRCSRRPSRRWAVSSARIVWSCGVVGAFDADRAQGRGCAYRRNFADLFLTACS